MSKFNLQIFLQAYNDPNYTNSPVQNNFRWTRNLTGLSSENPQADEFDLAPGESRTVFSGTRVLASDGTTAYGLSRKVNTTNNYILQNTAGTAPAFRTARSTSADATTEITVTTNGPLMTLTSTGGTPLDLIAGGVVVGDELRIGNPLSLTGQVFTQNNQGKFTVLARTATSVTVRNDIAASEASVVLGAGFTTQFRIYSNGPVQVGDTIVISSGFSPVSWGSYKITDVTANYVEFYSTDALPQESGILAPTVAIYSAAKRFVYLEGNQKLGIVVNGTQNDALDPFIVNNSVLPGVFARTATVWSLSVTNNGTAPAKIFVASIE